MFPSRKYANGFRFYSFEEIAGVVGRGRGVLKGRGEGGGGGGKEGGRERERQR